MNPRIAAVFLALTLFPASSFAQDGRETFFRGVAALSDRRYSVAVDAFEESYRARAVPVVLYNLGLAYRGLGRNLAAIDAFERYLAQPAASATPEDITAIREAVAQLRESLVVVALAVTPSTAVVLVDGRPHPLDAGTLQLDPGAHMLECSAAGYSSERREIRLEPGARTALSFSLQRLVIEPPVAIAVRQRHVPVLPIAIVVGVVVVGAIVIGVAASSRTETPYMGGLGNVTEGLHAR